jgi:hypothetical protein
MTWLKLTPSRFGRKVLSGDNKWPFLPQKPLAPRPVVKAERRVPTAKPNCELAGVDQQQAEKLIAQAHTICPYSKATHGNIEVTLLANGKPVAIA